MNTNFDFEESKSFVKESTIAMANSKPRRQCTWYSKNTNNPHPPQLCGVFFPEEF